MLRVIFSMFVLAGLSTDLVRAQVPVAANPTEVKPAVPKQYTVETHKDIRYRTDADSDKDRHTLDVYCPKGAKNFPVVLFVHGGSWESGNKSIYAGFGEIFAKQGIGFVICNYRLTPKVKHPGHIEDVASAFAWTCENMGKYGGNTDGIFLCGHSAGGHLVSLLATDPQYLKVHKHSPAEIKGVAAFSGVYRIYHNESIFEKAFGANEELCKKASPLFNVKGKHPPFLIAYADKDYEHLDEMAKDMHAALQKAECPSELLLCKNRNHITIIVKFAEESDPLNQAFRNFVLGKNK